jgi:hypothetical protein
MTREERTAQRSQRRSTAKAARATDRKRRGGRVETESLYSKRSPASAARARAAQRTKGRDESLYGGRSEADKARGRAAGKAAADKRSQAARTARGGLHSSAAAKDRQSTKAKEVDREGLYNDNSPANRARGAAASKAAKDASNQAKRDATSPEYKAEQERKKREAEEKKRKAEARAKELEAKAKEAREKAEKLKGKEKRAARDEAEKFEAEAKVAREDAKAAASDSGAPETEHLYSGTSKADKARTKAATKRAAKQPPLYVPTPARAVSVSTESATAPLSAPPVVSHSAQALHDACTRQAWSQLETQVAMMS